MGRIGDALKRLAVDAALYSSDDSQVLPDNHSPDLSDDHVQVLSDDQNQVLSDEHAQVVTDEHGQLLSDDQVSSVDQGQLPAPVEDNPPLPEIHETTAPADSDTATETVEAEPAWEPATCSNELHEPSQETEAEWFPAHIDAAQPFANPYVVLPPELSEIEPTESVQWDGATNDELASSVMHSIELSLGTAVELLEQYAMDAEPAADGPIAPEAAATTTPGADNTTAPEKNSANVSETNAPAAQETNAAAAPEVTSAAASEINDVTTPEAPRTTVAETDFATATEPDAIGSLFGTDWEEEELSQAADDGFYSPVIRTLAEIELTQEEPAEPIALEPPVDVMDAAEQLEPEELQRMWIGNVDEASVEDAFSEQPSVISEFERNTLERLASPERLTQIEEIRQAIIDRLPNGPPHVLLLLDSETDRQSSMQLSMMLGTTLARQHHQRVLLMDASSRRPGLSEALELSGEGTMEVLLEGEAWPKLVRPTATAGLDLLPSGDVVSALGLSWNDPDRQRLSELLADMRNAYGWVVIDGGNSLSWWNAELAAKVDGVFLVVELGTTRASAAAELAQQLQRTQTPLAGCVVLES